MKSLKTPKGTCTNKNAIHDYKVKLTPVFDNLEYEALAVTKDNRIIARNVNNGYLVQVDKNFKLVETLNMEGLFWLNSRGLLLNSGTLLIYNRGKIYRSTDTEYKKFELVFTFRENCILLVDNGWDKSSDDTVMFGEYAVNEPRVNPDDQKLWMGKDDGRIWTDVATFKRNPQFTGDTEFVRHFHLAQYDPYTDKFWVCTGDGSDTLNGQNYAIQLENRVMTIDTEGNNLEIVGTGAQKWRVVGMVFTPEYVIWGTDGPMYYDGQNPSWSFFRLNKRTRVLQRAYPFNMNTSIFGIYNMGNYLLACGTAEPGQSDNTAKVFVSSNQGASWEVAEILEGYDTYSRIQNVIDVGGGRLLTFGTLLTRNGKNYVSSSIAYNVEVTKK